MNIHINGEQKKIEAGTSISALIAVLGIAPSQIAVELNGTIAPKSAHGTTQLSEGDRVEIVRFIGGG